MSLSMLTPRNQPSITSRILLALALRMRRSGVLDTNDVSAIGRPGGFE